LDVVDRDEAMHPPADVERPRERARIRVDERDARLRADEDPALARLRQLADADEAHPAHLRRGIRVDDQYRVARRPGSLAGRLEHRDEPRARPRRVQGPDLPADVQERVRLDFDGGASADPVELVGVDDAYLAIARADEPLLPG